MKNIFSKIANSYKEIPNKKPYIEFFAALLTIPVLLTVILLNLNSLKGNKDDKASNPVTEKIYVTVPTDTKTTPNPSQGPCVEGIGNISITSPEEDEIVTDNPVLIRIDYKKGKYCEAVWSYRINSGKWSDYDDKSIALYQLPKGDVKLELRVKSIVSAETETLTRKFVYQGESPSPTQTPAPTITSSAN